MLDGTRRRTRDFDELTGADETYARTHPKH